MNEELKTLKDIEDYRKTIDKIGGGKEIVRFSAHSRLKQELGIKWIKEFKKYSMDKEIVVDMAPNFHYTHGMRCGAILVLKQIYGITEEDLKVKKITQIIGILASDWNAFMSMLDDFEEKMKKEKLDVNKADYYLTVNVSGNTPLEFKKREDIKHKNYPAKGHDFYIKFGDLK